MAHNLLNPLLPPARRFEWVRKILRFVDDFAVAKLHDADGVGLTILVNDRVFRDPEISAPEDPVDLETRWLSGMMTPQSL